jgi:hypothetical protein
MGVPMPEHFTRSTVSAAFYCKKCERVTQHRIDDRRKGPCLDCIARLERQHVEGRSQQMEMELSAASEKNQSGQRVFYPVVHARNDSSTPAALNPVSMEGIPWADLT